MPEKFIKQNGKNWQSTIVNRIGRGVLFHIAPTNVPVNFAYSLATGLLAGNANLIRVSQNKFSQIDIICETLQDLISIEKFRELRNHTNIISYDHNDDMNKYFSINCDVRIIWGGDSTISKIRTASLPVRTFDLTFADRYSLCVINALRYLDDKDYDNVANGFYNDTYLFDQNACTQSAHLIIWLGDHDKIELAKIHFWNNLHRLVKKKYNLSSISAVDKLTKAYKVTATKDDCRLKITQDNLITRIELGKLEEGIEDLKSSCGYFYEYSSKSINDLIPIINSKYQTMAYYGIEQIDLKRFIERNCTKGIDRKFNS